MAGIEGRVPYLVRRALGQIGKREDCYGPGPGPPTRDLRSPGLRHTDNQAGKARARRANTRTTRARLASA